MVQRLMGIWVARQRETAALHGGDGVARSAYEVGSSPRWQWDALRDMVLPPLEGTQD